MSAIRSFTRVASRATIAPRAAAGLSVRAMRPITASATKAQATEVVTEKEVPVTTWPQTKDARSSIPVPPRSQSPPQPIAPVEDEEVHPLTAEAYEKMSPMMRKMTVFGKTIIITGAARGLGNYMARACAEAGAKNIVIFDANQELGDEAAAELYQKTKIPVSFYKVDVRDGNAINAAVDRVCETYGVPDVLVNSAGIADSNIKAEEYDSNMFRRLIDINLTGTFLMSQAVGRKMIAAGKPGSIILVASMSGSVVNYPQEQSCYNASKAGVVQFGKSIAAEWAKHNIRVNCISPGYMDTALNRVPALEAQKQIWKSLTPQNRLGAVDDLNGLCVFLASDASGFMTGANVLIDGGYSCY
ncbi:bacilysin biosynthesis oxidoreductase bacC [Plectosphaerella cucumerina]|uniref:Bacilysin biosynthesis oxidoreductase bacC n=1 Tax=Plectosphaerella cucumerina TaxID=40658 RepID=A0A8K0TMY9_9PEZI|nr:bacilysin biosynthesis oxidoreductase bacC [Plectosphaerella cucumerina]